MNKKLVLAFVMAVVLLLLASTALVDDFTVPEEPGGLFLVDIDGERVVLQFYGSEQAWQYSTSDTPGWRVGLAPHPFGHKIWYPHLEDSQDMVLDDQLDWIDALDYAGIKKWRIGTYWDTTPLKASIFGGLPDLTGPNRIMGYNSLSYFPETGEIAALHPDFGVIVRAAGLTMARTGNEPCGDDPYCDGAIIEVGPFAGFHWENYPADGLQISPGDGMTGLEVWAELSGPYPGFPFGYWYDNLTDPLATFPEIIDTAYYNTEYYALPRTHGEDHWACFAPTACAYDNDLNATADYLEYGSMVGEQPLGVWTVTDKWPKLDKATPHTVTILAVINPPYVVEDVLPAGSIVPVTILNVEKNRKAPAPSIDFENATVTFEISTYKKNVYQIEFEYEGVVHTFKVKLK